MDFEIFTQADISHLSAIAAVLLARWPKVAKNISMAWPLAPVVVLLCSVPLIEATGRHIIPWDWNGMHGALWATVVLACAFGEPLLSWLASRHWRDQFLDLSYPSLGHLSRNLYRFERDVLGRELAPSFRSFVRLFYLSNG